MGLAVLGDYLYVVYHKMSAVYMYNKMAPFHQDSAVDIGMLKWPRGMAASQKHRSIYVTDWSRPPKSVGKLWCISEKVKKVLFLVSW